LLRIFVLLIGVRQMKEEEEARWDDAAATTWHAEVVGRGQCDSLPGMRRGKPRRGQGEADAAGWSVLPWLTPTINGRELGSDDVSRETEHLLWSPPVSRGMVTDHDGRITNSHF
jgi:hypothetical protein